MSTPPRRISTFSSRTEPKERQIGLAAAAYTAILLIILWAPHIGQHVVKGSYPPTLGLIGGILAAIAVLAATLYGRRYILGVVAILTVLAFPGTAFLYALPLWAFGGWMMFKASREAGKARRAERLGQGASARERVGAAARAGARDARGGGRKAAELDASGRAIPQASKRYTPPRPKNAEEPKGIRARFSAATKAAERQQRRPRPQARPGRQTTGR